MGKKGFAVCHFEVVSGASGCFAIRGVFGWRPICAAVGWRPICAAVGGGLFALQFGAAYLRCCAGSWVLCAFVVASFGFVARLVTFGKVLA